MSELSTEQIRELLDSLYRVDSGRILATLIRLLGDFDLAEEAMHEAFATALSLWPSIGVPGNPRPWLISTARFKAIDTLRRRARFDASQDAHNYSAEPRGEGFMFIDPASCFHAAAQRAKGLDRLHMRCEGPRVASPEPWEVAHEIALRAPVI